MCTVVCDVPGHQDNSLVSVNETYCKLCLGHFLCNHSKDDVFRLKLEAENETLIAAFPIMLIMASFFLSC